MIGLLFFLPVYVLALLMPDWRRLWLFSLIAAPASGALLLNSHLNPSDSATFHATWISAGAFFGAAGRALSLWLRDRNASDGFAFLSQFVPLIVTMLVLSVIVAVVPTPL